MPACYNVSRRHLRTIFVCCRQVALGKQHEATTWGESDKPPEGKHSTLAMSGQMCDPANNVTVPAGNAHRQFGAILSFDLS